MRATPAEINQTGDGCIQVGWYEFAGYVDGASEPTPALEECFVLVGAGETFPSVSATNRACYWSFVIEAVDEFTPASMPGQAWA